VQNYFAGVAAAAAVSAFAVSTAAGAGAATLSVLGASVLALEEQDTHATAPTTANNKTNFFIFFYLLKLNINKFGIKTDAKVRFILIQCTKKTID
jgi:hypothetical protein